MRIHPPQLSVLREGKANELSQRPDRLLAVARYHSSVLPPPVERLFPQRGSRKRVGHSPYLEQPSPGNGGRDHEVDRFAVDAVCGHAAENARTEIRGNVVTCVLVDAVADYNRSVIAPQTRDAVQGEGKLTPAAYKRDAVAAVVRVTRQRVARFLSSHDRDTDVATEVFTLEPSLKRGAPALADRRLNLVRAER